MVQTVISVRHVDKLTLSARLYKILYKNFSRTPVHRETDKQTPVIT